MPMPFSRMILFALILFLSVNMGFCQQTSCSVFFPTGIFQLEKTATSQLDSLVYYGIINPSQKLRITGFTDYVGNATANDTLSLRRAKSVSNYLQDLGIPVSNISLVAGLGEVERTTENASEGWAADRRVTIEINPKTVLSKQDIPTVPKTMSTADLDKLPLDVPVPLHNIYFPTGSHFLMDRSFPSLDGLVVALQQNPTVRMRIEGHVCCTPNGMEAFDEDTGEMALSVNRAKVIYQYLLSKGIDKERLEFVGFGHSKPLVTVEKTLSDTQMNRRVEMRVISR